jgi:Protein of unknown function (DUF3300)
MDRLSTRLLVVPALAGIAFILTGAHSTASAQTPPAAPQAVPEQTYTADQLDNMVAPIALYPDGLLSQVLVASTYPLEVAQAQQWLQQYPNLRGTQLTDAAKQQPWDPSVQALVAFPDVLARLNQDMQWTTSLGNAFLSQESDVMAAVQRMRQSAQASGKLTSTPQQTVTTQMQNGQPEVVIQPANPDVLYVPNYNPAYVWGAPSYGYYPSLYYPSYGWGWGPGIGLGLLFGGWGGWGGWGWGPNWGGRTVIVNNDFFHRHGYRGFPNSGRTPWAHNPEHRRGLPYSGGGFGSNRPGGPGSFRPPMNQPGGVMGGGGTRPGGPGMPGTPGSQPGRGFVGGGARPGGLPATTPQIPGNIRPGRGFVGGNQPGTPPSVAPGATPRPTPPITQPDRSGFMGGGMRPGTSANPGVVPQGGASRMMPTPATPARPTPAPGFSGPRGFGGGGFNAPGRSFGGGHGGFTGGRPGGFGGGGRGGFGGGGRGGGRR